MSDIPKPEVMFDFSDRTLMDLQLASLDRAARHLKAAKAAWHEAVTEQAIAVVARYFLDHRAAMLQTMRETIEVQSVLEFPQERKRA